MFNQNRFIILILAVFIAIAILMVLIAQWSGMRSSVAGDCGGKSVMCPYIFGSIAKHPVGSVLPKYLEGRLIFVYDRS